MSVLFSLKAYGRSGSSRLFPYCTGIRSSPYEPRIRRRGKRRMDGFNEIKQRKKKNDMVMGGKLLRTRRRNNSESERRMRVMFTNYANNRVLQNFLHFTAYYDTHELTVRSLHAQLISKRTKFQRLDRASHYARLSSPFGIQFQAL